MSRRALVGIALVIGLNAVIWSLPQAAAAQEWPCVVTCVGFCDNNENKHEAQAEGDTDEWDGGTHSACFDLPCCRMVSGSCKHPSCIQGEEQEDADASALALEMIDLGLERDDMATVAQIMAANPSFVLDERRSSIQLLGSCSQGDIATTAVANLPLRPEQFAQLSSFLELK